MQRFLAAVHAMLALAAFGIGNTVLSGGFNGPGLLHLILGATLFATSVALWKKGHGLRWAVALNLTVATLVAAMLIIDRVEGTQTSMGLIAAATAFVLLQVFTLRYSPAGAPHRRNS